VLKLALMLGLVLNFGCSRGDDDDSGHAPLAKGDKASLQVELPEHIESLLQDAKTDPSLASYLGDFSRERILETRERANAWLALLMEIAEAGNPVAQYEVGMFSLGQNPMWWPSSLFNKRDPNYQDALRWLTKAAEQGVPSAQRTLGSLYLEGKGVPQDLGKGKGLVLTAAEAGDLDGIFHMGWHHEQGRDGTVDLVEAMNWFRRWIFSHNLFSVGPDRYLWGYDIDGEKVTKIPALNAERMLRAAKTGDPKAQYRLGQHLAYEEGDNRTAAEWFLKAAEKDYAPAQYELAYLCEMGLSWTEVRKTDNGVSALERLPAVSPVHEAVLAGQTAARYGQGKIQKHSAREREKADATRWYRRSALNGWVRAQYALGMAYKKGELIAADPVQAASWLEMAATNGHTRAQLELANLLYDGSGTDQDFNGALTWFRSAAAQGLAEAQYKLGVMHEYGEGTAVDQEAARKAYEKAAYRLHPAAYVALGRMFYRGKGGQQDIQGARHWFMLSAVAPKSAMASTASMYLGHIYEKGEGVDPDPKEAQRWYSSGTEGTKADSLFNLGRDFRYGSWQLHEDSVEGFFWLEKAAMLGSEDAQFMLAIAYSLGDDVTRDHSLAAKWYRAAADSGIAEAQYFLAAMYEEGEGVSEDKKTAAGWYLKAADQGHAESQFALGRLHFAGDGVTENYSEAYRWYERAACQGHAGAQINLGVMHVRGLGTPEDYVEAYKWYIIAASQGEELAEKNRDALRERMTKEQIAAAQRRAAGFVASPEKGGTADPESSVPVDIPPKSSGTGFLITEKGHIVTAGHVVEGGARLAVSTSRGVTPAKLVHVDKANDIAILKMAGVFRPLPVSASSAVKMGDSVFTIGFPNIQMQGRNPKLTRGTISSVSGAQDDPRHFQISVPVQPGNSGGPLIDSSGNVIGLVHAKLDESATLRATGALPENVNYALKSSFILALLEAYPGIADELLPPKKGGSTSSDASIQHAEEAVVMILVY